MNKTAKIYVAGHEGLVGSALVRALHEQGYNNLITRSFADLDLRNQSAVDEFFCFEKPEYVFLAAAKVGGILANNTYKAEFIYDNIMIAVNVIHASYKHNVKKLLNLGSSCIYPKNAPQPLKEEYLLTGPLESTNEPYAIAKIAAIKLCQYYNEQYGTNFMSVMPTNLYGPNDNFNLETAHVLPALLRKFHLAKMLQQGDFEAIKIDLQKYKIGYGLDEKMNLQDTTNIRTILQHVGITEHNVTLWGTGKPRREFLYVDDLAQAIIFLINQNHTFQSSGIVNIGTGKDIEIIELAKIVKEVTIFDGKIIFEHKNLEGMQRKILDISKLIRLEWKNVISLKHGISITYEWYKAREIKFPIKMKNIVNYEKYS